MVSGMARTRRLSSLRLDPQEHTSPGELASAVVAEIAAGRLGRGDPLPSTRALAADLGRSRSMVVAAYDELAAGGFVTISAGSGARVDIDSALARTVTREPGGPSARSGRAATYGRAPLRIPLAGPPRPDRRDLRYNLVPGAPDVSLINQGEWRRAWRTATASIPALDWYTAMEHPELETALLTHLRRTRGIPVEDSSHIIVFPGVSAAIEAVVSALRPERAAMEDPGYLSARTVLQQNVPRVDFVRVDGSGLRVEELDRQQLVYVTPAHQYPLGGRMPVGRRDALLRWAADVDAVIIEDDFDGEFRHEAAPLGPLRAMAGGADRVVYIGTASKVLTPHLRLAWAVVPPWMSEAVRRAGGHLRVDSNRMASCALAELINSGSMARHLARAQRTYAARRHRLVSALAELLPEVGVVGVEAGIHVAATWSGAPRDTEVARACERRGVAVAPLSQYAAEQRVNGLLLGYAQLPETAARDAVGEIAAAMQSLATPTDR